MKVYKIKDNKVIEVECEKMEYPLRDNDGDVIFINTHFKAKKDAFKSAVERCEAGVRLLTSNVKNARDKAKEFEVMLADECIDLENLRKELRCLEED